MRPFMMRSFRPNPRVRAILNQLMCRRFVPRHTSPAAKSISACDRRQYHRRTGRRPVDWYRHQIMFGRPGIVSTVRRRSSPGTHGGWSQLLFILKRPVSRVEARFAFFFFFLRWRRMSGPRRRSSQVPAQVFRAWPPTGHNRLVAPSAGDLTTSRRAKVVRSSARPGLRTVDMFDLSESPSESANERAPLRIHGEQSPLATFDHFPRRELSRGCFCFSRTACMPGRSAARQRAPAAGVDRIGRGRKQRRNVGAHMAHGLAPPQSQTLSP